MNYVGSGCAPSEGRIDPGFDVRQLSQGAFKANPALVRQTCARFRRESFGDRVLQVPRGAGSRGCASAQCCLSGQDSGHTLLGDQRLGAFERHAASMHKKLNGSQRVYILRAEHAPAVCAFHRTNFTRKLAFPVADDMGLNTEL